MSEVASIRSRIIPKNVVKLFEELKVLGFPVRWTVPYRVFIVEGGTIRYVGLRRGMRTFLLPLLIPRGG